MMMSSSLTRLKSDKMSHSNPARLQIRAQHSRAVYSRRTSWSFRLSEVSSVPNLPRKALSQPASIKLTRKPALWDLQAPNIGPTRLLINLRLLIWVRRSHLTQKRMLMSRTTKIRAAMMILSWSRLRLAQSDPLLISTKRLPRFKIATRRMPPSSKKRKIDRSD